MPKNCFVVGPIGAADSPVRVHADWLLEEIISPVMQDYPEFVVHRADKLNQPGLIDTQVITHLLNDDLVIADITTLNPNAFYEIGIRHMAQKPIIHMHKKGEKIPFDISAYRSIEFSLERPNDLREARGLLKSAVDAVLANGYRVDNPVTHARGVVHLQEQATDSQRVLLDEMEGIKERLNKVERPATQYVVFEPRKNIPSAELFETKHILPSSLGGDASARSVLSSFFEDKPSDKTSNLDSAALNRLAAALANADLQLRAGAKDPRAPKDKNKKP
jgi:hypothetical protein